jgi:phage baseplate assembly protein W
MNGARPNRRLPPPPSGWPLLPVPRNGSLDYPALDASVRQMIRVILLTRPGEQLLHPEFGVGLEQFLHGPNTITVRRRIHDAIAAGLERFEPRITVDRIEVELDPERADRLDVAIAYRLRRTGQPAAVNLAVTLEA